MRVLCELMSSHTCSCVQISKVQQKYYDPCRCAICNLDFKDDVEDAAHDSIPEATFELSCKHVFHEHCIRGWALVGKKDTCPLCNEKATVLRH